MYLLPSIAEGKPDNMSTATMSNGAPVTTFCSLPCAFEGAGFLFETCHDYVECLCTNSDVTDDVVITIQCDWLTRSLDRESRSCRVVSFSNFHYSDTTRHDLSPICPPTRQTILVGVYTFRSSDRPVGPTGRSDDRIV